MRYRRCAAGIGYCYNYGFKKWEDFWGKPRADFRVYNDLTTLWNNPQPYLHDFYAKILKARENSPALRSHNNWFMFQSNDQPHDKIFAVAKFEKWNSTPADNDVVLVFVCIDRNEANEYWASFPLDFGNNVLSIEPTHHYNVRNLAASDPNAFLWDTDRTGQDLLTNGITVGMKGSVVQDGRIAQYLKLVDVDANPPAPDL